MIGSLTPGYKMKIYIHCKKQTDFSIQITLNQF